MSKSHRKKRNVGLLYEFLVGVISRSLIDGNDRASRHALKIMKRYFKPGTELHKEFRLLNSLLKTKVSSTAVAASILQEAKVAARAHDVRTIEKQKSFLIKEINHSINDPDFYDQQVADYKIIATIQTLINDWREPSPDISRLAMYEDQLVNWLVSERAPAPDVKVSDESPGVTRLLMKTMMKKLNEKYSSILDNDQRSLVKAYAFSAANDDEASIKLKLTETKDSLLRSIDLHENKSLPAATLEKLREVKCKLLSETFEKVDDDTVVRFMLYSKLRAEIDSGEDE